LVAPDRPGQLPGAPFLLASALLLLALAIRGAHAGDRAASVGSQRDEMK
jgi:hypothetical protein